MEGVFFEVSKKKTSLYDGFDDGDEKEVKKMPTCQTNCIAGI